MAPGRPPFPPQPPLPLRGFDLHSHSTRLIVPDLHFHSESFLLQFGLGRQGVTVHIADILFDGLDRMRDAIRRIIRNGEMPIVKMFGWLLAA